MRTLGRPVLALVTLAAVVAFTASAAAVGWAGVDRIRAGVRGSVPRSLEVAAEEHPSAAAYRSLARARAAAGDSQGAAQAALSAARLAPGDAVVAAEAERALDVAMRARWARLALPTLFASGLFLVIRATRRWRERARRRRVLAAIDRTRGTVVVTSEGPGQRGALVADGATAVVLDVHLGTALGDLRRPPPLSVALSHASAGRTIRLTPVREYAGSAVRVRVAGPSLDALLAHPGRWRVHVRAQGVPIADAELSVSRSALRASA